MLKLNRKQLFELSLSEMVLIVILLLLLGGLLYNNHMEEGRKERDAQRLVDMQAIQRALKTYKTKHERYPACLYQTAGCVSLEGSTEMPVVPHDPLTNLLYTYAASQTKGICDYFHLGISLERTQSQALIIDAGAPPKPSGDLCKGSSVDFSGFSYVAGGQPCTAVVGTPQPTDAADGETCYDLKSQ